jgi:hypothetical protein
LLDGLYYQLNIFNPNETLFQRDILIELLVRLNDCNLLKNNVVTRKKFFWVAGIRLLVG